MSGNNTLWSFVKKYKWNSIFLKYAAMIFTFIVLPTTIITFLFFYNSNQNNQKIYIQNQSDFYSVSLPERFASVTDTIYSTQISLSANPLLKDYFYTPDLDNNERAVIVSQIYTQLTNICQSSPYIDSIYIYNKNTGYIISNINLNYIDHFPDDISSLVNSEENFFGYRNTKIDNISINYLTHVCAMDVYGYPNEIIIYNINCERLSSYLCPTDDFVDKIYISNHTGYIVYSNDNSAISKPLSEFIKDKNFFICSPDSAYTTAFTYTVNDHFTKMYTTVTIIYSAILITTLLIIVFILSRRFFVSIIDIINILNGDSDTDSYPDNEFRYIASNISSVMRRNEFFENELAKKYTELKQTQLAVLQNQINPHFMFNVLNTISLLDIKQNGKPTDITQIINMFSDILRALISSKKYIVSLKQELSYVNKYVALQNIKYKNKFIYTTDISPDANDVPVIKFMLQPLVENCITHGILKQRGSDGIISVSANINNGVLTINVTNSGNEIPKDFLEELNYNLKNNIQPTDKHIGLLNVNNRIKLLYGEKFGCNISHAQGKTTVILTLPNREFEEFLS